MGHPCPTKCAGPAGKPCCLPPGAWECARVQGSCIPPSLSHGEGVLMPGGDPGRGVAAKALGGDN